MRKLLIVAIISVSLLITGLIAGCDSSNENYDDKIDAVQKTMIALSWDNVLANDYEVGDLEDGVAVLVNVMAAYWVKDDVVYAANGIAKTWSPNLDYSPVGIDFNTVEDAVN